MANSVTQKSSQTYFFNGTAVILKDYLFMIAKKIHFWNQFIFIASFTMFLLRLNTFVRRFFEVCPIGVDEIDATDADSRKNDAPP
jgi:hypothetical protein